MEFISSRKEYDECEFKGVDLTDQKITGCSFHNCSFRKCSFREVEFTNCLFDECRFIYCNFSLSKMKGSTFSSVTFENSQLIGIDWTITGWRRSRLFTPVAFRESVINYGTFSGLNLSRVKIVKCIARNVDFSEADLTQADCSETDFTDSIFLHTNLSEANFLGATGYAIDPANNVLKKARFAMPEAISLLTNLGVVLDE